MMKYFTMGELVSSKTADAHGIDNRCNREQQQNLLLLVEKVLDPLREAYGKPIHVNSGFRCAKLNKLVGGAKNSDHMNGCAADIVGTPNNKEENKRLFKLVSELGLSFDQLINESNYSWVHVSYKKEGNRHQRLRL